MSTQVILTELKGTSVGKEYVFGERTTCILGRARDCYPQLVIEKDPRLVSRHHCLLDINPPDIRVRDFGSLNGTCVNGELIGKRDKHQSAAEGAALALPECDLKDGDEISILDTTFRVRIIVPPKCGRCGSEIPESARVSSSVAGGGYECAECKSQVTEKVSLPPARARKTCAQCGKDVAEEIGKNREGQYVCTACKADPFQVVKDLLRGASAGQKELVAIEGYSILRELGRGGMGAVYLARNDRSQEQVALKVMLPEVATEQRARDLFLREMRNTKALRHPNVVRMHESGCSGGVFFCTLEFCDLGSVDGLMKARGGTLPQSEAFEITLQALDGLAYAHSAEIPEVQLADGKVARGRGLVHRDLKPQNIFLKGADGKRVVKIADYGLSKAFDMAGLSGQTRTGTAAGTPLFMPRQQVINFKYAKPDVDVWAIAASLYNMLTGHYPRNFSLDKDVWQTVLTTSPVPIRRRDASIPSRLAELLDHALDDAKDLHFKSAEDFKRALLRVL